MEKEDTTDWGLIYYGGALLTGIITFIGVWIYSISEWGFLLGIALGWIPAIISAFIAGFLWPIVALLLGLMILQMI